MHHTQIAQRVFNTPLMVDPAKALAFLTGLGPRITGREISVDGLEVAADDRDAANLPARASLFGDDLTNRQARNGGQQSKRHQDKGEKRIISQRHDGKCNRMQGMPGGKAEFVERRHADERGQPLCQDAVVGL